MVENLLSPPKLYGDMFESADYRVLGIGDTHRVYLIGHSDHLPLNDPYQVVSMKDAVIKLGLDPADPLLRALLEAYYSGARDIWLVAAAPYDEYVEELSERSASNGDWGGLNFYEQYYNRLEDTYAMLVTEDLPQFVVPFDAPFYGAGEVDFVTQLANHCKDSFVTTGAVRLGIMGADITELNEGVIEAIEADTRLMNYDVEGKFILTVLGRAVYNIAEMVTTHQGSITTAVAGMVSQAPINRAVSFIPIPQVINLSHQTPKANWVERLSAMKVNAASMTQLGKRGRSFQTIMLTDNTLATNGSDYWSLCQLRLVMVVIDRLRIMGKRYLGTIGYIRFQEEVNTYLLELMSKNIIRDFQVEFDRVANDGGAFTETVNIALALKPYFGIRIISFTAAVGPGA